MSFEQIQKYDNLLSVFREKSLANSDKPYLWSKQNSDYVSISWSETYKAINNLANYIKSIVFSPASFWISTQLCNFI